MREIILDTETTGLDPFTGHRIVEIGAVEMVNKSRTGRHFHVYINPERDMPPEAERVHGLSSAFLSDKPVFAAVAQQFVDFIADSKLVIHNAGFDMKFINYELEKHRYAPVEMSRAIDTVIIARKKFPGSPASLDALCRRFDIDLSARTHHGALLDAELLAEVYIELCGGRQVTISFDGGKKQASSSEDAPLARAAVIIAKREFPLSEEEKALHAAMVAKLKNAVWNEFDVV